VAAGVEPAATCVFLTKKYFICVGESDFLLLKFLGMGGCFKRKFWVLIFSKF
jgi:hypothetical protein